MVSKPIRMVLLVVLRCMHAERTMREAYTQEKCGPASMDVISVGVARRSR